MSLSPRKSKVKKTIDASNNVQIEKKPISPLETYHLFGKQFGKEFDKDKKSPTPTEKDTSVESGRKNVLKKIEDEDKLREANKGSIP